MKKNPEFKAFEEDTLLRFLLKSFPNKSRNYVKGILKRGQVSVDAKPCTDYALALLPGQTVTVSLNPAHTAKTPFPVLYEDDELIAINKPPGMLAISTDREKENTAYHIVTDYIKISNKAARIFIVHRLDRETSGIMLFAKNEKIKRALQDDWENLAIHRGYTALVEGEVLKPDGEISSWLKQTKTLLMYSSREKGDGKLAVTQYTTLHADIKNSLLQITLKTGRKNQIRVHMSEMGHPIAGDKKYGAKTDPLKRLCLHASDLGVMHPFTGEKLMLESKADFMVKFNA